MAFDEIPRITKPLHHFPSSVSPVYNDHDYVDAKGTRVIQGHYWRRVQATNVPCGNTVGLKIGFTVGVSQAVLMEVASALEIGVAPLKDTLSVKLSRTDTVSNSRTVEFTRTIGPKQCVGLSIAEWQKVITNTLQRQPTFLGFKRKMVERSVEFGTEETFTDQFEYPDPTCCKEKIQERVQSGFDQVYALQFGAISLVVLAKENEDGSVMIDGLEGRFAPGQPVEVRRVAAFLASHGYESQPVVRLSNSLGSARHFFQGEEAKHVPQTPVSSLPFYLALGCAYALILIVAKQMGEKEGAPSESEWVENEPDWVKYVEKGHEYVRSAEELQAESASPTPEQAERAGSEGGY